MIGPTVEGTVPESSGLVRSCPSFEGEDRADAIREHLATQATDAALRLTRQAEQADAAPRDRDSILVMLEHLSAIHPDHERLAQHAIRLYQAASLHDAARHTFTRLKRHLAELGLEPEPATRALITPRTQPVKRVKTAASHTGKPRSPAVARWRPPCRIRCRIRRRFRVRALMRHPVPASKRRPAALRATLGRGRLYIGAAIHPDLLETGARPPQNRSRMSARPQLLESGVTLSVPSANSSPGGPWVPISGLRGHRHLQAVRRRPGVADRRHTRGTCLRARMRSPGVAVRVGDWGSVVRAAAHDASRRAPRKSPEIPS